MTPRTRWWRSWKVASENAYALVAARVGRMCRDVGCGRCAFRAPQDGFVQGRARRNSWNEVPGRIRRADAERHYADVECVRCVRAVARESAEASDGAECG